MDKILNNKFNQGDLKNTFNNNTIKSEFNIEYEDKSYLTIEMEDKIYDIFINSKFKDLTQRELNNKNNIIDLFIYFYSFFNKDLKSKKYLYSDFFIILCESLDLDYKILYDNLPPNIKINIIKEKYSNRIKNLKLF